MKIKKNQINHFFFIRHTILSGGQPDFLYTRITNDEGTHTHVLSPFFSKNEKGINVKT